MLKKIEKPQIEEDVFSEVLYNMFGEFWDYANSRKDDFFGDIIKDYIKFNYEDKFKNRDNKLVSNIMVKIDYTIESRVESYMKAQQSIINAYNEQVVSLWQKIAIESAKHSYKPYEIANETVKVYSKQLKD